MMSVKKILVADDEEDILALTTIALRQEGYEVATAKNGAEAVAKTAEFLPDVLLLDVMMPILDGYHAAHHIMHDPALTKKPKIILMTIRDSAREEKLMTFSGAAGMLQKPFGMASLKSLVAQIAAS